MTKWSVLLLALVGVAALSALAARWWLSHAHVRGLPVMTETQLATAPYNLEAASCREFSAHVEHSPALEEDIHVMQYPDDVRFVLRHAGAEGVMEFSGPVDRAGRFAAGPHIAALEFRFYQSVEGELHGPAIVNGVPTIYIVARTRCHTKAGLASYIPRSWKCALPQTGRAQ